LPREAELVKVIGALNSLGGGLAGAKRGQQQRGKDRDDGDGDEEFN
jgi:hypothetical protein